MEWVWQGRGEQQPPASRGSSHPGLPERARTGISGKTTVPASAWHRGRLAEPGRCSAVHVTPRKATPSPAHSTESPRRRHTELRPLARQRTPGCPAQARVLNHPSPSGGAVNYLQHTTPAAGDAAESRRRDCRCPPLRHPPACKWGETPSRGDPQPEPTQTTATLSISLWHSWVFSTTVHALMIRTTKDCCRGDFPGDLVFASLTFPPQPKSNITN